MQTLFDRITDRPPRAGWLALLAGGIVLLTATAGRGQDATPSLPRVDPPPDLVNPSVFISDPAFGKDPFFPNSKRRLGLVTAKTVTVTNASPSTPSDELFNLLELKGISNPKQGRLVLVNRYTFGEGEERTVKVGGRAFRVRCVTIKDSSAILSVRGQTKELFMRSDLIPESDSNP